MADIDEIVDNFAVLDDWDDRYRYLIELGRELAPLSEAAHSEANKVSGCASQVWLDTKVRPNGSAGPVLTFAGDSDAHLVRQERQDHSRDRCGGAVRKDGFA
jgi:cysteine desulfuration protein SufE